MTRIFKKSLSRNFNFFGPRFQEWLARMFPALQGPTTYTSIMQDFRNTSMSESQRLILNRLVAMWIAMETPELKA